MNFRDFYDTKTPRFSFEIFPPKENTTDLFQNLKELKTFDPAFVSVTYGAMGSTQNLTRDLTVAIQEDLGIPAAFHFTCVVGTKNSIREYVKDLQKKNIQLVVALRGDPPKGETHFRPSAEGFQYANELVAYLKELGGLSAAVAGYPEKHIEAPSLEVDLENLQRKVTAGADIIITQLFLDNADYFRFVEKVRGLGIDKLIIPGILPIQSLAQIERITTLCGAKIPPDLHEELRKNATDLEKIKAIGFRHALAQCRDLLQKGVPGIHFYTLNKKSPTKEILESLY